MASENCYHCGADCGSRPVMHDDKCFCCNGCKTVYEILNENELSCYYDFESSPGAIPEEIKGKYNYLDNEQIVEKLYDLLMVKSVLLLFTYLIFTVAHVFGC